MTQFRVSHGRSGRPVTVGPYRLTEARYAPHQTLPRHEHTCPSWTILLAGSFEEVFARESLACSPGSVLTKPSAADHSNRYGPRGAQCLLIEAPGRSSTHSDLFTAPRVFAEGVVPTVARSIQRAFHSADPLRAFILEGLLIELDVASMRMLSPARRLSRKRWLNAVRDRLEAQFRRPPSLAELATDHDVHPVYLCQEFRVAFGVSVGEFVRTVRFEWARMCLETGNGSITDVALAAGFSDQAHLSRDFKRRAGTSPGRFRSRSRAIRQSAAQRS